MHVLSLAIMHYTKPSLFSRPSQLSSHVVQTSELARDESDISSRDISPPESAV